MPPPPPPQQQRQQQQRSQQQVPVEGSIQHGTVARIESYGAFVDLNNYYRIRGLIHISQLAKFQVERVEDVVAVDDGVWVKVLEVTSTCDDQGRTRHKISLSLKDVSQDGTQTDLGAQAEHQHAISQQIQRNLHSSIGMGVAMDPMASHLSGQQQQQQSRNSDRLILKHQPKKHETVINGYALVDDDEGEPLQPSQPPLQQQQQQQHNDHPTVSAAANPPPTAGGIARGRGRGTTLPAWMTRKQDPVEGLADTKASQAKEDHQDHPLSTLDRKSHEDSSDDDNHNEKFPSRKHKKKKKKKDDKKKRKHHKRNKKHKHKRHRKRSQSDCSYSSSSDRSETKRSHRNHGSSLRDTSRKRRRGRSRDDSSSSSSSSSSSGSSRDHRRRPRREVDLDKDRRGDSKESRASPCFQSVQEAQRLIEQLEAKQRKRND